MSAVTWLRRLAGGCVVGSGLIALAAVPAGCYSGLQESSGGSGGGSAGGQLDFYDETDTAQSVPYGAAVAVGAMLPMSVHEDTAVTTVLTGVRSSAPGVLRVTGFSGNRFTLQAVSAGSATITATTADAKGSVKLRAKPVASTELLWEAGSLPTSALSDPLAIVPGAKVSLGAAYFDASQQPLTGVEPISATPLSAATIDPRSDVFQVTGPSSLGRVVAVHVRTKEYDLDVVDPSQVMSKELVPFAATGLGSSEPSSFSVPVGLNAFLIGARLADGRYVFAPCGPLNFTATIGAIDLLPNPSGDPDRLLSIVFSEAGAASFSFQCLGKRFSYDVTITPT